MTPDARVLTDAANAGPGDLSPPAADADAAGPTLRLRDLRPGDRARVVGYRADSTADSPYCAQLMRLGLIPGTALIVQRSAPLGRLVEIRFRGFSLAIRPAEADCLLLEPL
jgi:Fe2+ transport system protein FeoA